MWIQSIAKKSGHTNIVQSQVLLFFLLGITWYTAKSFDLKTKPIQVCRTASRSLPTSCQSDLQCLNPPRPCPICYLRTETFPRGRFRRKEEGMGLYGISQLVSGDSIPLDVAKKDGNRLLMTRESRTFLQTSVRGKQENATSLVINKMFN